MTVRSTMPPQHAGLAALVAAIWGVNFLAIHTSLQQFPPLFLVALRFSVLAIPTLLLVPRPDVPLRWLIGYGAGFGVVQFALLYGGMAAGMPPGLASLVLQASAPLTLILGAVLLREVVHRRQWVGICVSAVGMAMVGYSRAAGAQFLPYLLVLLGAFGWALGNLSSRLAQPSNPLHLSLWMSVVVPVPMMLLSWAIEGGTAITRGMQTAFTEQAAPAWLGLLYTVVIASVVGSGIWTWLMTRYPAGVVAPFSMLVPIVGMLTAGLVLDEVPTSIELFGATLVILGVAWGAGVRRKRRC